MCEWETIAISFCRGDYTCIFFLGLLFIAEN
jgi:hypothetical protein